MIDVRAASRNDVPAMVAISASHRERLERYQPHLWRRRADADRLQASFFDDLLADEDASAMVAATDGTVVESGYNEA